MGNVEWQVSSRSSMQFTGKVEFKSNEQGGITSWQTTRLSKLSMANITNTRLSNAQVGCLALQRITYTKMASHIVGLSVHSVMLSKQLKRKAVTNIRAKETGAKLL